MCSKEIVYIVAVYTFFVAISQLIPLDDTFIEVFDLNPSSDHQNGKVFCNSNAAAVKFRDQIVDLEEAEKFSQHFSLLVSEIGRGYTTILLYLDQVRVNLNKQALSSIFLAAVSEENFIRKSNPQLEPIKVFLHVSVMVCTAPSKLHKIKDMVVGFANYTGKDATVGGIIFDASLIQTHISEKYGSYRKKMIKHLSFAVRKFKKSLQHTFGNELQFGMALSSFKECITDLASHVEKVTSSFDMVVINAMHFVGTSQGKRSTVARTHFDNCIKILHKKFRKLYVTREIYDFKN